MTTRKTDTERLQELEDKIEQIKARKQQVENRIKQKERKERTRRLIQVGAIFEKYFDVEGEKQAEQVAYAMKEYVGKNKPKFMNIDLEKSKEKNAIVYYKQMEETLNIPKTETPSYSTNTPENKDRIILPSQIQKNSNEE